MHYSVAPRHWTFVEGYGFLVFAKYIGKINGKNVRLRYSGKCSDYAKNLLQIPLKRPQKEDRWNLEDSWNNWGFDW